MKSTWNAIVHAMLLLQRVDASSYRVPWKCSLLCLSWGAEASLVSPFRCGMLLVLGAKCMISIGKHKIEPDIIINKVF